MYQISYYDYLFEIPAENAYQLIVRALDAVLLKVVDYGDHIIPSVPVSWSYKDLFVVLDSRAAMGARQLKWSTVGSVLRGLGDFMNEHDKNAAEFEILDYGLVSLGIGFIGQQSLTTTNVTQAYKGASN